MKKYTVSTTSIDEIENTNIIEIMTLDEFHEYLKDAIHKSLIEGSRSILCKKYVEDDFSVETLNSKGYPLNIGTTSQFRNGVKILVKKHNNKVLQKLDKVIDDLANLKVSTQYKNHRLQNSTLNDIHLDSDVILLYRYVGEAVVVDLELKGITDHNSLDKTKREVENQIVD